MKRTITCVLCVYGSFGLLLFIQRFLCRVLFIIPFKKCSRTNKKRNCFILCRCVYIGDKTFHTHTYNRPNESTETEPSKSTFGKNCRQFFDDTEREKRREVEKECDQAARYTYTHRHTVFILDAKQTNSIYSYLSR